jgi:hypothetical protein
MNSEFRKSFSRLEFKHFGFKVSHNRNEENKVMKGMTFISVDKNKNRVGEQGKRVANLKGVDCSI